MSDTPEFVNGLIFKMPQDTAPDFVKGSLSIKVEEMITFLSSKKTDWVNIDLKVSRAGKAYAQVNTFVPESRQDAAVRQNTTQQAQQGQPAPSADFDDSDIPFMRYEYRAII